MKIVFNPKNKTVIYTLICFLIGIGIWFIADKWQQNEILIEKKLDLTHDLQIHSNALNLSANKRFVLLEGLNAFVLSDINSNIQMDQERFSLFVSTFFNNTDGIRNMIIAPEGINKFVYPLKGNEGAVDHDLLNDKRPNVQADIKKALSSGLITLSGPYELRQGGLGVIARLAVYKNTVFWGFVTMALDVPPLLVESKLTKSKDDHNFAVFNDDNFVFYGDKTILDENPVVVSVKLPDGEWHLAGTPLEGWDKYVFNKRLFLRIYELLFIILITFVVYLISSKQAFLIQKINSKTFELQEEINAHKKAAILLTKSEDKLLNLVSQKEYLMRELQHRVKNNLNVVSSLLGLEIKYLPDNKTRQIFNNARNRINSMSSIYEKLYTSDDLQSMELHLYIKDLAENIFETYNIDSGKITLITNLSEIIIDSKTAIPLGLILNELISNVLKYAFPDNQQGEILISLVKKKNTVIFVVEDDGVGLPDGFDIETTESMGMLLVKMLSKQIDGIVSVIRKKGTAVSIEFKYKD